MLLLQCFLVLSKRISIWVFIYLFKYPLRTLSEFRHLSTKELLSLLFNIVGSQTSTFPSLIWECLFSFLNCSVDFRPLFSFSQSWSRTDLLKLGFCLGDISVTAPYPVQLRRFIGDASVNSVLWMARADSVGLSCQKKASWLFTSFHPS